MNDRCWPKTASHFHATRVSFGHFAAPGVSILKVSFLVSRRSKFPDQLRLPAHRRHSCESRELVLTAMNGRWALVKYPHYFLAGVATKSSRRSRPSSSAGILDAHLACRLAYSEAPMIATTSSSCSFSALTKRRHEAA